MSHRSSFFHKAAAVFTVFSLLMEPGAFADFSGAPIHDPLLRRFSGIESEIDPSIGSAGEIFHPFVPKQKHGSNPSSKRFVFHIQDAHASVEAQKNIALLLRRIEERYETSLIFIEGASGELSPDKLLLFSDDERNLALGKKLLEQGILGGAEIFLLARHLEPDAAKPDVVGVEDPGLYKQNLEAYQKVYALKDTARFFLKQLRSSLFHEAIHKSNPDLRRFFKEYAAYKENPDNFLRYLSVLKFFSAKAAGSDLMGPYSQIERPQLSRVLHMMELERKLSPAKAKIELEKLLDWAHRQDIGQNYLRTLETWDPGKDSMPGPFSNPREFLEALYDEGLKKGFSFTDYPELSRVWGHSILRSEINSSLIMEETTDLGEKILQALIRLPEEREMIRKYRRYLILNNLLLLDLTPSEYEEFKKNRVQIEKFMQNESSRMKTLFETAAEFYKLAEERNAAIFKNMTRRMAETGASSAVLITGGFHAPGLHQVFRNHSFAYVEILPRFTPASDETQYQRLMMIGHSDEARKAHINTPRFLDTTVTRYHAGFAEAVRRDYVGPAAAEILGAAAGDDVKKTGLESSRPLAETRPEYTAPRSELRMAFAQPPDLPDRLIKLGSLTRMPDETQTRAELAALTEDKRTKENAVSVEDAVGQMQRGEPLISEGPSDLSQVPTPWGIIDLTRLNRFETYGGETALAELARDLELAHWLGLINFRWGERGVSQINAAKALARYGRKLDGGHTLSWIKTLELYQDTQLLAEHGIWQGGEGEDAVIITFTAGRGGMPLFTVNGDFSEPDDAQIAFLNAHNVTNFGNAASAYPKDLKKTVRSKGKFHWSVLAMPGKQVQALRNDALTLARTGRWEGGEGEDRIVLTFRNGGEGDLQFQLNGEAAEPDEVQIAFFKAHKAAHYGSAFSVIPPALKGSRGLFKWSMIPMSAETVKALRENARLLAEKGIWEGGENEGFVRIEYVLNDGEPVFALNDAAADDTDEAQIAFLKAHGVAHYGRAFSAIPKELRNTKQKKGFFRWSRLNLSAAQVEELRRNVRQLGIEGKWRGGTGENQTVIEFEQGPDDSASFRINGEPAEPDDAQIAFLKAHNISHFGNGFTALPKDLKNTNRGKGKLEWSFLDMSAATAEALRRGARELAANGRVEIGEGVDRTVIEYEERPGGEPLFRVNGEEIEDPDEVQIIFLKAHNVQHFGNAFTVIPKNLRKSNAGRGKFEWSQLNMSAAQVEDLRRESRLLFRGEWDGGYGANHAVIRYSFDPVRGPLFEINGVPADPNDAQIAFYKALSVNYYGAAISALPREFKGVRNLPGKFGWSKLELPAEQIDLLRRNARTLLNEKRWEGGTGENRVVIEFSHDGAAPGFLINGYESDPNEAQIEFLKANQISAFGTAFAVLPSDVKTIFQWTILPMPPEQVEALLKNVKKLAEERVWEGRTGTAPVIIRFEEAKDAEEPRFFINSEEAEPDEAQITFYKALGLSHYGDAFAILPKHLKRHNGDPGKFGWSRLPLRADQVEKLRKNAAQLEHEGRWENGQGENRVVIEYSEGPEGEPLFKINGKAVDDPNEAQRAFYDAQGIQNYPGARSVLPPGLRGVRYGKSMEGKFRWKPLRNARSELRSREDNQSGPRSQLQSLENGDTNTKLRAIDFLVKELPGHSRGEVKLFVDKVREVYSSTRDAKLLAASAHFIASYGLSFTDVQSFVLNLFEDRTADPAVLSAALNGFLLAAHHGYRFSDGDPFLNAMRRIVVSGERGKAEAVLLFLIEKLQEDLSSAPEDDSFLDQIVDPAAAETLIERIFGDAGGHSEGDEANGFPESEAEREIIKRELLSDAGFIGTLRAFSRETKKTSLKISSKTLLGLLEEEENAGLENPLFLGTSEIQEMQEKLEAAREPGEYLAEKLRQHDILALTDETNFNRWSEELGRALKAAYEEVPFSHLALPLPPELEGEVLKLIRGETPAVPWLFDWWDPHYSGHIRYKSAQHAAGIRAAHQDLYDLLTPFKNEILSGRLRLVFYDAYLMHKQREGHSMEGRVKPLYEAFKSKAGAKMVILGNIRALSKRNHESAYGNIFPSVLRELAARRGGSKPGVLMLIDQTYLHGAALLHHFNLEEVFAPEALRKRSIGFDVPGTPADGLYLNIDYSKLTLGEALDGLIYFHRNDDRGEDFRISNPGGSGAEAEESGIAAVRSEFRAAVQRHLAAIGYPHSAEAVIASSGAAADQFADIHRPVLLEFLSLAAPSQDGDERISEEDLQNEISEGIRFIKWLASQGYIRNPSGSVFLTTEGNRAQKLRLLRRALPLAAALRESSGSIIIYGRDAGFFRDAILSRKSGLGESVLGRVQRTVSFEAVPKGAAAEEWLLKNIRRENARGRALALSLAEEELSAGLQKTPAFKVIESGEESVLSGKGMEEAAQAYAVRILLLQELASLKQADGLKRQPEDDVALVRNFLRQRLPDVNIEVADDGSFRLSLANVTAQLRVWKAAYESTASSA